MVKKWAPQVNYKFGAHLHTHLFPNCSWNCWIIGKRFLFLSWTNLLSNRKYHSKNRTKVLTNRKCHSQNRTKILTTRKYHSQNRTNVLTTQKYRFQNRKKEFASRKYHSQNRTIVFYCGNETFGSIAELSSCKLISLNTYFRLRSVNIQKKNIIHRCQNENEISAWKHGVDTAGVLWRFEKLNENLEF